MKLKNAFGILRHAFSMAARMRRTYAMLSVTIILSFSFLLGYLTYTDTGLYNEYKELFRVPRQLLRVTAPSGEKLRLICEVVSENQNAQYFYGYNTSGKFETYAYDADMQNYVAYSGYSTVLCIPDRAWGIYDGLQQLEIRWLDGQDRELISLKSDEMLMSEGIFYALQLDEMEEPIYRLQVDSKSGKAVYDLKVVGLLADPYPLVAGEVEGVFDSARNPFYKIYMAVSANLVNPQTVPDTRLDAYAMFYTPTPELTTQEIKSLNGTVEGKYKMQNDALDAIRDEKENKAIIAAALLVLLGINLYSSFSNALNERKFEIGVKRALGASGWSIVRQFLYESLIVMVLNILVSIVTVTGAAIVYKFFMDRTLDELGRPVDCVLYISPFSVGMFLVCASALAIVFSLIFAYKSTQVEIVQYLKAE